MPRRHSDFAEIRRLKVGRSVAETAVIAGVSVPTVKRAIRELDLRRTVSHSPAGPGKTGRSVVLARDHRAVVEKRALFPSTVRDVGAEQLLKSGEYSGKIGGVVLKGPWRGFPIYTLTLEERSTCPLSCRHWLSCYGNNMPFARRFRHGDELERRVAGEVSDLGLLHPRGFAVRLHMLGDFYSVAYVELWRALLEKRRSLHCFGFTARIDFARDPVAGALKELVADHWPRFAIRFSDGPGDRSTTSIRSPAQKPADSFVCPAQWTPSGKKTESCSTCGLCWATGRRVAFINHGSPA